MFKSISTSTIIDVKDIGEVKFHRNYRAKRLTISIRPITGIRVTVPGLLPLKSAKEFVEIKKTWIVEKQKEINNFSKKTNLEEYRTREQLLKYSLENTSKITFYLINNEIVIRFPINLEHTHKNVQDITRKAIEYTFRKEAQGYLPLRVEELTNQHGFIYNKLRIKNINSRWGSCSSKNNINLSIYLMKLPDELIDYIILHELTHTIHKNHGQDFWKHLDRITGNAKGFAARVRKYRTGI
jgi:predicted metal-dependent hydrolase